MTAFLLLLGLAWAEVPEHESLPRYPDLAAWSLVVAGAVPGLQACVDAEGPPQSDALTLVVERDGSAHLSEEEAAPSPCWQAVVEALHFPAHDEDPVALGLRFPVTGRTVRPPMEIEASQREIGQLFLHLPVGLSPEEGVRIRQAVQAWLAGSGATEPQP